MIKKKQQKKKQNNWVIIKVHELKIAVIIKAMKVKKYCNNAKYWDTLSAYHTCLKIYYSPFYCLLMCLKYCCIYGKQCRPWSDATFCGIWSGSTLFAKASLYLAIVSLWIVLKRVREKSRECHNHKPQPFPDTKRKFRPNQTSTNRKKRPFYCLFMCLKYCYIANSVDPDQMPHFVASDLGLHCLQRPLCPNT